jgi:hypothetical protein
VSPRLVSCGDAEGVPPVALQKIPSATDVKGVPPVGNVPLATDDVTAPSLSTSTLPSAPAAERAPYVGTQKGPVGIDDAATPSSMIKVANLVQ